MSATVEPPLARVAELLGRPVTAATRVSGSVANADFVMVLDDGTRALVKVGPAAELVAEAWACRRLTGLGLPVPAVLALDAAHAGTDRALLALAFVPGEASVAPDVARSAGLLFREVHALELDGWGSLVVDAAGAARGEHDSWAEALAADLVDVDRIVAAGVIDATLARRACRLVLDEGGPTAYAGPAVLLHRDLKAEHLFAADAGSGAALTAVIDWGFAGAGDPELDLARLSMAGDAVLRAFLEGLGRPWTPELELRLARYRIWWDLSTLVYEHRAGGSWFGPYRDRVAADVALLGRAGA